MRPCLLFFSTDPTSKLSETIRNLGDGRISHTGLIYWSDEFEQWMVLDAIESGWVIRSYAQFIKQGNKIIELGSFKGYDLFAGVRANKQLIGVPYDWNALVGRGVMKWVYALTGRVVHKNHWNDSQRYYCNEIAAKVLQSIGINVGKNIDMDPFQLFQIVKAHPAYLVQNPEMLGNP